MKLVIIIPPSDIERVLDIRQPTSIFLQNGASFLITDFDSDIILCQKRGPRKSILLEVKLFEGENSFLS